MRGLSDGALEGGRWMMDGRQVEFERPLAHNVAPGLLMYLRTMTSIAPRNQLKRKTKKPALLLPAASH